MRDWRSYPHPQETWIKMERESFLSLSFIVWSSFLRFISWIWQETEKMRTRRIFHTFHSKQQQKQFVLFPWKSRRVSCIRSHVSYITSCREWDRDEEEQQEQQLTGSEQGNCSSFSLSFVCTWGGKMRSSLSFSLSLSLLSCLCLVSLFFPPGDSNRIYPNKLLLPCNTTNFYSERQIQFRFPVSLLVPDEK